MGEQNSCLADGGRYIVVLTDWYLPGFKAGGPIRTLSNLMTRLCSGFSFSVVTRDRDIGDAVPYENVPADQPFDWGHASVYYLRSSRWISLAALRRLRTLPYDLIYCNSLFSFPFSVGPVWAQRFGLLRRTPVVLAPRGELGGAALERSKVRKRALIGFGRLFGVYRDVIWQATDEAEQFQIRQWFGEHVRVALVSNMGAYSTLESARPLKRRGELALVLVGRVSRMKNVVGALEMLREQSGNITLDVFGPVEDESYFRECNAVAAKLPSNVRVVFRGPIRHDVVSSTMQRYHALFLPTLGENFGHAILEALAAGVPVITSNRTPWRNLQARSAGWDLPLEEPRAFADVIAACVEMEEREFDRLCQGARLLGNAVLSDESTVVRSMEMFRRALKGERGDEAGAAR